MKNNLAIFGFKDSFAGQLINMLDDEVRKNLNCLISYSRITKLNINKEHKKRPNKKTEFVKKKKFLTFPFSITKIL